MRSLSADADQLDRLDAKLTVLVKLVSALAGDEHVAQVEAALLEAAGVPMPEAPAEPSGKRPATG